MTPSTRQVAAAASSKKPILQLQATILLANNISSFHPFVSLSVSQSVGQSLASAAAVAAPIPIGGDECAGAPAAAAAAAAAATRRMGCLSRHQLCLGGNRGLPFVRKFKHKEIEAATNGFSTILEAGPGGHAAYRARFADGLVATVRRAGGDGDQDREAFYRELQLLARLNHRHIVRLHGFSDGHSRFLVFDQMENRTLKECLHDPLRTPLNWRTRLQVAIDVAAALEYLYYFCDPPVFHVSVNSSNVMMDANFVAKLSDVSVIGYDPKRTPESNAASFEDEIQQRRRDLVFQYGVLILELVTGQSPGGEGELVQWVQEPGFACTMYKMVDADLGNIYDSKELRNLVIMARLCTRPGNDAMVSIPLILRYLQGKVANLGCESETICE